MIFQQWENHTKFSGGVEPESARIKIKIKNKKRHLCVGFIDQRPMSFCIASTFSLQKKPQTPNQSSLVSASLLHSTAISPLLCEVPNQRFAAEANCLCASLFHSPGTISPCSASAHASPLQLRRLHALLPLCFSSPARTTISRRFNTPLLQL